MVAAAAFLKHYEIEVKATERYPATMIGDVLAVDFTRRSEDGDAVRAN